MARVRARLRREASDLAGCLRGAGLSPRPSETSPQGSIALEAPLKGAGRVLLFVYPTPAAAAKALPGIVGFMKANGGQAKLESNLVVGYTTPPTQAARVRVEPCL